MMRGTSTSGCRDDAPIPDRPPDSPAKGAPMKRFAWVLCAVALLWADVAFAQSRKPNILVIFGDDIGQTNISAYSLGVVGYRTPNIDRLAREGMLFTDYYAENSCTAGRSTFITGQTPLRTGLSKVGIPGAPVGLQARDV